MNELFEKELRNISINGKSLADYVIENYVPMSVIKGIKAEIESKTHPDFTGHNEYEMAVSDGYEGALLIIDKHIERSEE